jgi:hypothetical protein
MISKVNKVAGCWLPGLDLLHEPWSPPPREYLQCLQGIGMASHTHQIGVAVQLVFKPSVWSLNKISDLVGRLVDYLSKFNSLLRFLSSSTILPLGTSFRP